MWIFTNKGFISAVMDRKDPDKLIIRARFKSHLQALFPDKKIVKTKFADYAFRCFLNRTELRIFMLRLANEIVYPNFKDSVKPGEYHDACKDVWKVMFDMQWGRYRRTGRSAKRKSSSIFAGQRDLYFDDNFPLIEPISRADEEEIEIFPVDGHGQIDRRKKF